MAAKKKAAKKSSSKKAAKKATVKKKAPAKKASAKKSMQKKMPASPTVKIYSTPTCPWCDRTKQFFKENGVKYTDINVAVDAKARGYMIQRSGQMGVPVIEIGNKIIVGYDEESLRDALDL
ncbi:MAG TPA: glutaredoxin domain-containing protein [Candidatus Nanoarchaeia archaeon]|nr:glutaredoxin domain-containing protein [Candidatus Nanoarchaeia archaeon]